MPDAPPAQPRRARKVPQYDEYGNYLGDIRDDELRKMEETKQVQSPAIPSPRPPPLPEMREPILRSGHAVPTSVHFLQSVHERMRRALCYIVAPTQLSCPIRRVVPTPHILSWSFCYIEQTGIYYIPQEASMLLGV